jgi:hypothetical protein
VRRGIGAPLQGLLRFLQPPLRFVHGGEEIVGREEFRRILRHLFGQLFGFVERAAVTQRGGQAHLGPGHDAPFEHPPENFLGFPRPPQLMQELALETQGVVHVGGLLLDHAVAGGNRLLQGAALDLLIDPAAAHASCKSP